MLFSRFGKKSLTKVELIISLSIFFIIIFWLFNESISNPGNDDPTVQYNQDGYPEIVNGTYISGLESYLNTLGEGQTYDVEEEMVENLNYTLFHATFDSWSTTTNCGGATAEGWNECYIGETGVWRGSAGGSTLNASSTQKLRGSDIDTSGNAYVTKCLDLSSYFKAYLKFDWSITGLDAGEYILIRVNTTNSPTLTDLWNSGTGSVAWTNKEIDVTANISSNTCFRVYCYKASATNEYCDLDDFKIIGETKKYGVEVWHNSTAVSYSGLLNSINVTLNFTTNVTETYSLQIYNWANNEWNQTPCQSGSVAADAPTQWWCNVTDDPMQYNSSDMRVRIKINSTADSDVGLLKEDYVQYYISYTVGYLEVQLFEPDPTKSTYVTQNNTFLINATVTCKYGPCGDVYGTVRYNSSSINPDTEINTTYGDKPFFVNETPAYAMKACPNNPLNDGDFCNITWIVNATGDIDTAWKIGVLFNSSYPEVQQNRTENATVYISYCTEEIDLSWSSIDFGILTPDTKYNPAPYNDQKFYNITNKGSCPLQLWIKGTDLQNSTLGSTIGVGNLSWSNMTNDYTIFHVNMTYDYVLLNSSFSPNQNLTTYYWLTVPPVYIGNYIGSVYICGNYSTVCE